METHFWYAMRIADGENKRRCKKKYFVKFTNKVHISINRSVLVIVK